MNRHENFKQMFYLLRLLFSLHCPQTVFLFLTRDRSSLKDAGSIPCFNTLMECYSINVWRVSLWSVHTENHDHSTLISFPYVAIQSPSLCLFQILWRSQTLLLLFQLPWIPPARQPIGGNNKLSCFKPLTTLSPN